MDRAMQAMTHMATGCHNAKEGLKLMHHLRQVTDALSNSAVAELRNEDDARDQTLNYNDWEKWMSSSVNDEVAPALHEATTARAIPVMGEDIRQDSSRSTFVPSAMSAEDMNMASHPVPPGYDVGGMDSFRLEEAFYAAWPDNLDTLGLTGFEDFSLPDI